jgi:predicted nucleic acid-binding protein
VITAVDTSVLLDVFGADERFGPRSRLALRRCLHEGALVACDVVWAEVVASFPDERAATDALRRLDVTFAALDAPAATAAGHAWRSYRRAGGRRDRVVSDFLVAGHALVHADRLLTRDRGFVRGHFGELTLVDPSDPS